MPARLAANPSFRRSRARADYSLNDDRQNKQLAEYRASNRQSPGIEFFRAEELPCAVVPAFVDPQKIDHRLVVQVKEAATTRGVYAGQVLAAAGELARHSSDLRREVGNYIDGVKAA